MSILNDEIIDAEYSESNVVAGQRSIEVIETEIITITRQAQISAMQYICEIGRRLCEAKELVEHGQWGIWLETKVDYSQSTAENFMKIFKEYKDNQLSLFGDLSQSQTLGKLNATKLLLLTSIPADEREQFVEDNDAENISVREFKQRIKDKQDIIDKLEKEANDSKLLSESNIQDKEVLELMKGKKDAIDKANKKQKEIDNLKLQIEELSSQKIEPSENELEQMKADAEAIIKAEFEDKLKQAEMDKDALQDTISTLEDELRSAVTDAEKKAQANMEAELNKAKDEKEEAISKIAELEKKLKGSNTEMSKLNIYFSEFQTDYQKVQECLESIKDNENFEKLKQGIIGQISSMIEMLSGI